MNEIRKKSKFSVSSLVFIILCSVFLLLSCNSGQQDSVSEEIPESSVKTSENTKDDPFHVIAYVTVPASENWRWIGTKGDEHTNPVSEVDTRYVTHINFAFGMIEALQFEEGSDGRPKMEGQIASREAYKDPEDGQYHYRATVNGWIEEMETTVEGERYLKALVKLKEEKPDLKVLLSIGGWDSDGFCYMAQTEEGRKEFIESCIQLLNEYQLDGIDLDWEYPTNGGWGAIASCENCVSDAKMLLTEFREALNDEFEDSEKLLTIASGCSQPWVDSDALKALDYINVMCYDYSPGSGQDMAGLELGSKFMQDHLNMVGDSEENRAKLNLGIPFYNEGGPYLVPYYKPYEGHIDASPEITEEKMNWVKDNGYGGAFYWAYSMDVFSQDVEDENDPKIKILQRTVYETLNGAVK